MLLGCERGTGVVAVTVLVDAENVRRSRWPNLSREELVERCRAWGESRGRRVLIVFDGEAPPGDGDDLIATAGTADDWLVENAAGYAPYWLVTSDRELRRRAGEKAERILGGGSFLSELLAQAG
jgi:hypothetical protein